MIILIVLDQRAVVSLVVQARIQTESQFGEQANEREPDELPASLKRSDKAEQRTISETWKFKVCELRFARQQSAVFQCAAIQNHPQSICGIHIVYYTPIKLQLHILIRSSEINLFLDKRHQPQLEQKASLLLSYLNQFDFVRICYRTFECVFGLSFDEILCPIRNFSVYAKLIQTILKVTVRSNADDGHRRTVQPLSLTTLSTLFNNSVFGTPIVHSASPLECCSSELASTDWHSPIQGKSLSSIKPITQPIIKLIVKLKSHLSNS